MWRPACGNPQRRSQPTNRRTGKDLDQPLGSHAYMIFAELAGTLAVAGEQRRHEELLFLGADARALRSGQGHAAQPGETRAVCGELRAQEGVTCGLAQETIEYHRLLELAVEVAALLRRHQCLDSLGHGGKLRWGSALGAQFGGKSLQRTT